MIVAVPIGVHQVQMGQLLPQKIQIVFHWLPRCRWGHHIAHAQQAGRIYLLQGLSQLPGGGAQVTLPWGKALQQNFMIQCLRSVRQTAQALHQPGPQRPPGHAISPVAHGDEGVLSP